MRRRHYLTCRCSSLLRSGDTHLVPGLVSCGANRSTQPRRTRPSRHPAGQRCDSCGRTPVVLRRHCHQQEAAAPELPEEGAPTVSSGRQIAACKGIAPLWLDWNICHYSWLEIGLVTHFWTKKKQTEKQRASGSGGVQTRRNNTDEMC